MALAAQMAFHVSAITSWEYMPILYTSVLGIILFRFFPVLKGKDKRYKKEQKRLTREANRIASKLDLSKIRVVIQKAEEGTEFVHTVKNRVILITPTVIDNLYENHYDALLAAIAHEVGHISRKDGEGMAIYSTLAINALAVILAVAAYLQLSLVILLQLVLFSVFIFLVVIQKIARTIEFKADAIAATLVGATHIINVLKHLEYDFSIFDYLFGAHPKIEHRIRKLGQLPRLKFRRGL